MAGITIPIIPVLKISNGCVCTPDGGVLYGAAWNVVFIGNCGKSGMGVKPVIKQFPMQQKIVAIDVNPNWPISERVTEITAAMKQNEVRVAQKHFAVLAGDKSIEIWDFDQKRAIMGHKAHLKTFGSVLISYMRNGNLLSMDSRDLIVFCSASNLYSRKTTFFKTRHQTMTILRCSPHNENIFAVGTGRGVVIIGNLEEMSVIYTLSGHSAEITSLSWCPENEEAVKLCFEKPIEDELSIKQEVSHILLASASIDGNIWIWNTETGAGCDNVRLSRHLKLCKYKNNAVVWLSSSQLVTSNKAGELSNWTIGYEGGEQHRYKFKDNQKYTFQKRDVVYFNVDRKRGLLWCISWPREISCDHLESREVLLEYSCASLNVSVMRECPDNMNKIALGFSDNRIGIIDISNLSPTAVHIDNYEGNIGSSVVSLVWSPDSQRLAFGTLNGRVGVFDVETKKCKVLKSSSTYPIYSMDWHYSQIFFVCNRNLVVYNYNCESKGARVITEVQNASCISVQFDILLVGTRQGRLHVYHRKDVPDNSYELIQDIELIKRSIQDIAWCPIKSKIAVVGKSNSIHVLKYIPENGTVSLIQKTVIKNEKAANFCAKWSNAKPYQLLTCGFDGAVRVWDFNSGNAREIFRKQFQCKMKSGLFLPTDEKILMCSGTSTSIELIDMREEENMACTNDKVELSKEAIDDCVKLAAIMPLHTDKKPKVATKNRVDEAAPCEPLDVDDTMVANDKSNENVSDLLTSLKIDESELHQPPGPNQIKANLFSLITNELNGDVLTEINAIVQSPIDKQLLCSKLFGSISEAKELLARELNQNQTMESPSLAGVLMPESIKDEIIRCIKEKKLKQWHVSLAPTISFQFWAKCCEAFAEQLLEQGCALQAASHLIALNRIADAIEMLVSGNYHKEALLIGRIYLESQDTLLSSIVDKWILRLESKGNLYGAALICILSCQFDRAVEMLSKVRGTSKDIKEVIKILRTKIE